MKLTIPELALVVLIGPDSPARRKFMERNFRPDEVFEADLPILEARLEAGRLTVVGGENASVQDRAGFHTLCRRQYVEPVAILFDLPARPGEDHRQLAARRQKALDREGFHRAFLIDSEALATSAQVERAPLPARRPELSGPFDIIGDIHGCFDELQELLTWLGYLPARNEKGQEVLRHPAGRKAVFLGDLVDRGPCVVEVLRLVMAMCAEGSLCVPGNHDVKFVRKLQGHDVKVAHGLELSLAQLNALPPGERQATQAAVIAFFESLPWHYLLDQGRLVVAHAGLKEPMHGRAGGRVKEFALFGETTGETDDYGLPVRLNWAQSYEGKPLVVYGHTAIKEPAWLNNTVCVDTGCVFGGRLTALRYPEREVVQVKARRVHYPSRKPLGGSG